MNGIIVVNKPQGFTSHDVVAKLRGILKTRRIGHSGTLDPMATGVLPVFVGRATRACEFATADSKTYRAEMLLGVDTDTQDITGKILKECPVDVDKTKLDAVLPRFLGEISQIPPMYSAIKVDGKKLYELARQGVEIERKPRQVVIHSISAEFIGENKVALEATVSKGTYIRTICRDIGEAIKIPELKKQALEALMDASRFSLDQQLDYFCLLDAARQDALLNRLISENNIEQIRSNERYSDLLISVLRSTEESKEPEENPDNSQSLLQKFFVIIKRWLFE